MKTQREIAIEAERLERIGSRYWAAQRSPTAPVEIVDSAPVSRRLLTLPETTVHTFHAESAGADAVHAHRKARWIEIGLSGRLPEYDLVQEEFETTASGRLVRHIEPLPWARSDRAEDVLAEGYDLVEEDRLVERLALVLQRMEEGGLEATPELIDEVERIVEAPRFSAGERLKMRVEVVEFLEGWLEPGDFIAAAIERQRRRAETLDERLSERQAAERRLCYAFYED